jgi:hypothetical protein
MFSFSKDNTIIGLPSSNKLISASLYPIGSKWQKLDPIIKLLFNFRSDWEVLPLTPDFFACKKVKLLFKLSYLN